MPTINDRILAQSTRLTNLSTALRVITSLSHKHLVKKSSIVVAIIMKSCEHVQLARPSEARLLVYGHDNDQLDIIDIIYYRNYQHMRSLLQHAQ